MTNGNRMYKKQINRTGKIKTASILASAIIAGTLLFPVVPVFAASPSFARTQEEWATLQDNNMEYNELADLVHEYNATVQQNQIDYQKFKKDYGTTKDDVSQSYEDLADEIMYSIDYPDEDDANYATTMVAILSNETTAKSLQSKADDNLEDAEIMNLKNELAEKTLVQVAQNNMISYHIGLLNIEDAKNTSALKQLALNTSNASQAVGSSTQIDVLNAKESLLSAQQAVTTAQASLNETKQKLCIMLGWGYDANPVIGDIPEPDMTRIDSMNPSADKETALSNNYTLQINKKKLANATSQSQKDTLNSTITDNEANIGASLVTAYQGVTAARDSYNYAQANASLQNTNLNTANTQYSLGMISSTDLQTQQYATNAANSAFEQAKLNLFEAMEGYDWAVKGLAGT